MSKIMVIFKNEEKVQIFFKFSKFQILVFFSLKPYKNGPNRGFCFRLLWNTRFFLNSQTL